MLTLHSCGNTFPFRYNKDTSYPAILTHTHTTFLQEDLVRQVKEGTLVCDDRDSVISSSPTTNHQTSDFTAQGEGQKSPGQQEGQRSTEKQNIVTSPENG